jgi:hypothetical protein
MTNPEPNESHARHDELRAWIRKYANRDFAKAREHAIQTYGDFFKKDLEVNCMCNLPGACAGIHFEDRLRQ